MRGRLITEELRSKALQLYEEGNSFDEIRDRIGVSKASLSGIINDSAEQDPDVLGSHEIARYCRENDISLSELSRGTRISELVRRTGAGLDDLENVVVPFLKTIEGDPVQTCKDAQNYAKLVDSTGKSHDQLVEEHKSLTKQLGVLSKKVAENKEGLKQSERRVQAMESELSDLEELASLNRQMKKIHKAPSEASEVIATTEEMLRSGLTVDVLKVISMEIRKQGQTPRSFAMKLVQIAAQYEDASTAIETMQRDLNTVQGRLSDLKKEESDKEVQNDSLRKGNDKQESALHGLQVQYNELNSRYFERETQLRRDYAVRKDTLEKEIQKKERHLRDLRDDIEVLDELTNKMQAKLHATSTLWSFILGKNCSKKTPTLASLRPFGLRTDLPTIPLSEGDREVFVDALEKLCMNDVVERYQRIERQSTVKQAESFKMIRSYWRAKDEIERRTEILLKLLNCLKSTEDLVPDLCRLFLSDPEFLVLILSQSPILLRDALARTSQELRDKLESILSQANSIAESEEEKRFDLYFKNQLKRILISMCNPYPAQFQPLQNFALASANRSIP